MEDLVHLYVERESNGSVVFIGRKRYYHIPQRNDVVFYDGKNYKVIYRKFVYLMGNDEVSKIILRVQEIDKKF